MSILFCALLVSAALPMDRAAWADVGYVPPADISWPPRPTPGLTTPAAQSARPSVFAAGAPNAGVPAPGPSIDDPQPAAPAGMSQPANPAGMPPSTGPALMPQPLVNANGQPITPFPMADGTVVAADGGVTHIFDPAQPTEDWVFRADALWLQRSIGTDNRLGVLRSHHTTIEQLDSDDGGYGMNPGLRLQLIRRLNNQVSLEAIYFGLQNWSGGNTLFADPVGDTRLAYSPYTQTDKLLRGFDTSLGYVDRSSLQNFEFNVAHTRVDFGNWRWGTLVGFRYFEFTDHLNINGIDTSPPAYENVDLHAYNNLLGGQFGGYYQRDWNRFHLQLNGKLGLMGNIIHLREGNLNSSGYVSGSPAGFYPFEASATRMGVAGVLDFSAMASYEVRPNFLLRAGYQLLYVPGVALAPNQLDGLVHQGGVFLHGPSAGLEFRW